MILEVKNLNKSNISFSIDEGDFLLVFGPDDAGKTNLLYQIMGLRHFRDGEILFEGKSVRTLNREDLKKIRFVPDNVCMENITAREYFSMLAKGYLEYSEEDVQDLCEYFGVDLDCCLTDMTYNENKLTMIIGAMVTMPRLLILDEPLNFMTEASGKKLLEFLKYLSGKGIAVLVTSDISAPVSAYCSHYIYFRESAVAHSGLVRDIYGSKKAVTITKNGQKNTQIYEKAVLSKNLSQIVMLMGDADIEIETLTLEEILDDDITRWM